MSQTRSVSIPPVSAPRPVPASLGGGNVSVNSRFVAVDGEPVFPVSGEVHYSRIPRELWDDVLRRARAGGLTHVATYAFWNHHADAEGNLSFDGDLDVRHFLELAAGHGLGLLLRLGPYVHSESRHGGLPDRIADAGWEVRTNDPGYLAEVSKWYAALFEQVQGLDLFGVQVDNELYDQPDHLVELRRIAERVGFSAPLWTATAWGAAQLPDDVFALYGGYTDSFWIESTDLRDDRSLTNFYISRTRDDDGIGADHRKLRDAEILAEKPVPVPAHGADDPFDDHPFATCELGGGMVSPYHRRPVVTGRDVEALGLTKLASGSIWQGYYMYADGRNPRRGLQECHAVGEPNDFMELGYDFGASLTLDGVPRETWFRLRRQHLFLERWGSGLATMPAVFPEDQPKPHDLTSLRWSVRSDGERGFLFVVNHQPSDLLPAHEAVSFEVALGEDKVTFPAFDVPAGSAFVLPFGLEVGGVRLEWATAQPVTELTWQGLPLLVLAAVDGIEARFGTSAEVAELDVDGPGDWWSLAVDGRTRANVVVLSDAESLRLGVAGERVVLGDAIVAGDRVEAFEPDSTEVDHLGEGGTGFGPATYTLQLTDDGWRPVLSAPAGVVTQVPWSVRSEAGAPPATVVAPNGRASVPTDWSAAAHFTVTAPADGTLVLEWQGDVARAWDGDRLVSDAVFNGREWRITAAERVGAADLRIEILPLADDAPVLVCAGRPSGCGITAARVETPGSVALA
ncbi:hypothetical protein GCM10028820_12180 [Tessaracoccus terricola]